MVVLLHVLHLVKELLLFLPPASMLHIMNLFLLFIKLGQVQVEVNWESRACYLVDLHDALRFIMVAAVGCCRPILSHILIGTFLALVGDYADESVCFLLVGRFAIARVLTAVVITMGVRRQDELFSGNGKPARGLGRLAEDDLLVPGGLGHQMSHSPDLCLVVGIRSNILATEPIALESGRGVLLKLLARCHSHQAFGKTSCLIITIHWT